MKIRAYQKKDLDSILSLFYHTVHTVCSNDYTPQQLDAWAPDMPDRERWERSFHSHTAFVAEKNGTVVGFADCTLDGYFDRLYVHYAYQRQGVATMLADKIEEAMRLAGTKTVQVDASVTAKPFFKKRGYKTSARQEVERFGVVLENFKMIKLL